ncbi:MAG: tRNA (adenosine(37)-N6)-dimethylallyltransferase MiaA [Cytophagales bacterium]|nr:tRNA (adenosine(37)-N6)-dimethylallyltransferase MiaA [Cytophagales bacterium]
MNNRKLLVVVGPTAVGKTAVAIRLAEHYRTEVVSADSRQIYREMNIGTAKPSEEELKRVTHHFINVRSVREAYDAGAFGVDARSIIDGLFRQHQKVILCGGSGLYIQSVLEGFDDMPAGNPAARAEIVEAFEKQGLDWLQGEVAHHDPDYFEIVDRKNPQRLMRALEIIRATGAPYSGFRKKERLVLPYEVVKIGLTLEREELYRRIDQRVDEMMLRGLFEEAAELFPHRHLGALQTVGYQEVFGCMEGKYSREEAVDLLKRNTRRYAKRQMTWFRRDPEIRWFSPSDWEGILGAGQSADNIP